MIPEGTIGDSTSESNQIQTNNTEPKPESIPKQSPPNPHRLIPEGTIGVFNEDSDSTSESIKIRKKSAVPKPESIPKQSAPNPHRLIPEGTMDTFSEDSDSTSESNKIRTNNANPKPESIRKQSAPNPHCLIPEGKIFALSEDSDSTSESNEPKTGMKEEPNGIWETSEPHPHNRIPNETSGTVHVETSRKQRKSAAPIESQLLLGNKVVSGVDTSVGREIPKTVQRRSIFDDAGVAEELPSTAEGSKLPIVSAGKLGGQSGAARRPENGSCASVEMRNRGVPNPSASKRKAGDSVAPAASLPTSPSRMKKKMKKVQFQEPPPDFGTSAAVAMNAVEGEGSPSFFFLDKTCLI